MSPGLCLLRTYDGHEVRAAQELLALEGVLRCINLLRLKTTELYLFIILEVRSLKSRGQQAHTPSKTCRGESFLGPGILDWLGASLDVTAPGLCLCGHTASSLSVCLLCASCKGTCGCIDNPLPPPRQSRTSSSFQTP